MMIPKQNKMDKIVKQRKTPFYDRGQKDGNSIIKRGEIMSSRNQEVKGRACAAQTGLIIPWMILLDILET
jgi:hypothetical protein